MAKTTAKDTLLSDYQQKEYGEVIRSSNITASCMVADAVRSTLGPNGRDKLIIHNTYDVTGNYVVTNDGATILEEMKIEHPAGKMVAEVGLEQNETVGDGTTSSTALTGELLRNAASLIETGVHPSTIANGYHQGSQVASERLEELAITVSASDTEKLQSIAKTAMAGRVGTTIDETLSELIVRGLVQTRTDEFNREHLQTLSVEGGAIDESELVDGLVLDKSLPTEEGPRDVTDATVTIVDGSISIEKGQYKRHQVTDPEDVDTPEGIEAVVEWKQRMAEELAQKYIDAGVDAIFPVGYVDKKPLCYLARNGILTLRHVERSDLEKIASATGATAVNEVEEITPEDLGFAARIREVTLGSDARIRIETDNRQCVTLVLRGGTEHTLSELERTVDDAISVVCQVANDGRAVTGGGATEIELAEHLRRRAKTVDTREQLAMEAYADSLEVIPRTLARNAGKDTIDTLTELYKQHADGETSAGVSADGSIGNLERAGVVEPLSLKRKVVQNATEVAIQLLCIDGIIATEPLTEEEKEEHAKLLERGDDPEEALEEIRP